MTIPRGLALLVTFGAAFASAASSAPPQPGAAYSGLPLQFEQLVDNGSGAGRFAVRAKGFDAIFDAHEVSFISRQSEIVRMRFVGANPDASVSGAGERSEIFYHGLTGSSTRHAFERIEYRDLYPGVHLSWHSAHGGLEYDFQVDPQADPSRIRVRLEGAPARPDGRNGLALSLRSGGQMRHGNPVAYQEVNGVTREVRISYRHSGENEITFETGDYDRTRPLIIDPTVSYSSYVGGAGSEQAFGVTVDVNGFVYIVGETNSTTFPGTQATLNGRNYATFVTKVDPVAKRIVFTATLAGNGRISGRGIGLDTAGAIYIAGMTNATDYPTTAGALRQSAAGQGDAFFAKLSANGATLLYSTLLGGRGEDTATAIAVTSTGEAFISGYTNSLDFPVTNGCFQSRYGGGTYDAFVVKVNTAGALSYATYAGGSGSDLAYGIAVDASGSAYLTGSTASTNFPVTSPVQSTQKGQGDGFVTKLNSTGSAILFSTYLGGSSADYGNAIVLDGAGSIYVAGTTMSLDFPVTAGVVQRTPRGAYDAFVAKYSGGALSYATYLGGVDSDCATALAVGSGGNVYVAGYTFSFDFPAISSQLATAGTGQAAFLSVLGPGGTALSASLLLQGSGQTAATGIALDAASAVYLTGYTYADDFLSQDGLGMRALTRRDPDAILVKLTGVLPGANVAPSVAAVTPSSGSGASQTFAVQMSHPSGFTAIASADILFTGADGLRCHVVYTRATSTLSLASENDLALLGPIGVGGPTSLQHSLCMVNGPSSSVTASGNNLTLNLALSFTTAFAGGRTMTVDAFGTDNMHAGPQTMAAWSVPGAAVPAIAVTPSSGSGTSQTFAVQMSNADGNAAIAYADMLITGNDGSRCHVFYLRSNAMLYLATPNESAWLGSATLGSSTVLQHQHCAVNAATSSVTASGNTLTLNLALSFSAAFAGARVWLADVYSVNNVHPGLRQISTWTVPGGSAVPSIASVTPSSGSGTSPTFAMRFSDADGNAAIAAVDTLVTGNDGLRCHVFYLRSTNTLYLAATNESVWLGSATIGSATILQHPYCSVNLSASSVTASGPDLTLNLSLTFTAAFVGSRIMLTDVFSSTNLHPGLRQTATWTVPAGSAIPSILSVTPSSGSGSSQSFAILLSDTDGDAAISSADILITGNDGLRCHVFYARASGTVYLAAANESAWLGSAMLGSSTILQHGNCSVNAAASSAIPSGNTLTLNVALSFTTAFRGQRVVLADVYGSNNLHPGLRQIATWLVP